MKVLRIMLLQVLFLSAGVLAGGDLDIAVRGRPADCAIVIPVDAEDSRVHAAEELRTYVGKITGVELPIERGTHPTKGVYLDRTTDGTLGAEGFRLRTAGDGYHVEGGCRGVLYGVYETLERFGGVGWYASWRTVVPTADRFTVPADLDERQVPSVRFRLPAWKDVKEHEEFKSHLRFNGGFKDGRFGGNAYLFANHLGTCHTFGYLLRPAVWFKDHPEYYSEVDGVRRDRETQLCLTNPDVLRLVTSNVLAQIRAEPALRAKDCVGIVGVSQNDNTAYCTCAKCRAQDEAEGSHAGTMVPFVNAIAEAVDREFPGMMVETLVYQYSRAFPKTVRYRENVIPCICSVECSWSKPFSECREGVNAKFMEDLVAWGRTTKNMFVWDYTTDYWNYFFPFPSVRVMQPNIRTFLANGCAFLYEEGGATYHADFAELKAWLTGKLSWNADAPLEPLLDRFFSGYYGAAAPFIRTYFNRVEAILGDDPKAPHLGCFDRDKPDTFTDAFTDWAMDNYRRALAAVKDDPECARNVRFQMGCMRALRLARHGRKAKSLWVAEYPEFVPGPTPGLIEDGREMLELLKLSKSLNQPFNLGTGYETNAWRAVCDFRRPRHGTTNLLVGVDRMWNKRDLGPRVREPTALNGQAIEISNASDWTWAAKLDFGGIAADAGRKYVVRFRARIDRAKDGKGEAFFAQFARQTLAPRAEESAAGWQWYAFRPEFLKDDLELKFKCGRFKNGGGCGAVDRVLVDRVEIVALPMSKPVCPSKASLIAHRGESYDAPENTLPAFKTAVSRGFGFECDVYLSSDGELFTFHDDTLKRTTDGACTAKCNALSWRDAISRVDVGNWGKWKGSRFAGTHPARFADVMKLARNGRWIYVELKGEDAAPVPYLKKALASQSVATPKNLLFISFSTNICAQLKRQMPAYKVYWLSGAHKKPEQLIATMRAIGVDGIDMDYTDKEHDADFISQIREAGFEFHVWTIDDPDMVCKAFQSGAKSVTTNRAKAVLEDFNSRRKP